MKGHNDRTKLYDGGRKEPTEISDGDLPTEDEHKQQLQRIVANHPMEPGIREANNE